MLRYVDLTTREALKGAVHILLARLRAGYGGERARRRSSRHGVAFLCGFEPSSSRWATPPSIIQQWPGHSPRAAHRKHCVAQYCGHLNPIERCGAPCREDITQNKCYFSIYRCDALPCPEGFLEKSSMIQSQIFFARATEDFWVIT